jgi:hypothetical protein
VCAELETLKCPCRDRMRVDDIPNDFNMEIAFCRVLGKIMEGAMASIKAGCADGSFFCDVL